MSLNKDLKIFLAYKRLISLGFFKTKAPSVVKNFKFVNVLFKKLNNYYMYNIKSVILGLYLLVPLIQRWSLKNYVFTFIDFGNKGLGFLELTLSVLKSSYSYVIYD